MKLACLSVDLDSLSHYCRIHGLSEHDLPPGGTAAAHQIAIPRLLELLDRRRLKATFFAVGEDLEDASRAAPVAAAAAAGHEVGNHTYSHDYALTRRAPEAIEGEIARGGEAVLRVTGRPPSGFRAPGYALTAAVYAVLGRLGYRYDSSALPSAPYYLAKAAVLAGMAMIRRSSASVLDRPRVIAAPRMPYRPDPAEPYRRGHGSVWELPVATERWTRVPFIGTVIYTLPRPAVTALYRSVRNEPFLCVELHAIDVLDGTDGASPALARLRRDLAVPASEKLARLAEVLGWIAQDFEVTTLDLAAVRLESITLA